MRRQEELEEMKRREKEERRKQRKERKRLNQERREEESEQAVEESQYRGEEERQEEENNIEVERTQTDDEDRVTLDVGGRHFATSRKTLLRDKESIFHNMLKEGVHHYTIDRDGGHFRYILNFLRAEGSMTLASLPRENRFLIELQNESIYYHLSGLEELVSKRLEMYKILGIAF